MSADSPPDFFQLAVIGGGINGCGIARDAAGRGVKTFLCESGDLASATSSASTKLVHGGLRYLERFHFRLVRESLRERETLLRAAPHLVRPMRFVLPHRPDMRPAWMMRLGLALYDALAGRELLPPSRKIILKDDPARADLAPNFSAAFEYSDCWADDSRLTIQIARDAARRGAKIQTRARCVGAFRENGHWILNLQTAQGPEKIRARALANAAGPWAADVAGMAASDLPRPRLVRGAHIVTPKFFGGARAYLMQGDDRRVVFAVPFESDFAMIGTTDRDHRGDPASARCEDDEAEYLLNVARRFFKNAPSEIVWRFAGVRALFDDDENAQAQDASRDYRLIVDAPRDSAPLLNVCGGKLTTHRRLAEFALEKLRPWLPEMGSSWTATAPLPGGDFPPDGAKNLETALRARFPTLGESDARRLINAYGTEAPKILSNNGEGGRERDGKGEGEGEMGEGRDGGNDWGEHFGAGLYAREVWHLMREEWAQTAEDILWRRSKLGLRLAAPQVARLDEWMRTQV